MHRLTALFIFTVLPITFIGCSMCSGVNDFDYPTYGGLHQRADPARGRVGSVLSDPFANFVGLSADSNLEPYPEPRGNSEVESFEGDDDLDRQDEDLDDDLEELDRELDRRDRERELRREELDRELDRDRELESIDPLDDEPELDGASGGSTTSAKRRVRRRRRR